MSLVLAGSEVMQVLDVDLALATRRQMLRAYGEGRVKSQVHAQVISDPGPGGFSAPC